MSRKTSRRESAVAEDETDATEVAVACTLCGRPFGLKIEDHHLIPKTFKGRETVPVHPICHRKIHATLTERELLKSYNTVEALLDHPEIEKFVKWVAKKDVDFYVSTHETASRRGR
jgi:5-methylcytosine-specific restriction endonuclease McrA